MEANADLPKNHIDALLAVGVYHYDPTNACDLDSICTAEAMQCLVGYAFRPSFSDPGFSVAIKLAREKISQLEYSINEQLDTATKCNVNFDVGKAPDMIRCKELQDLISKLEEEARAESKPKTIQSISQEDKGKGKRPLSRNAPPVES